MKSQLSCVICNIMNKMNVCKYCNNFFCDFCYDSIHHNQIIHKSRNMNKKIKFVNFCPYMCIKSETKKYCYYCGGNYTDLIKCNYCYKIICTSCREINYQNDEFEEVYGYCSQDCYHKILTGINNNYNICSDCNKEYINLRDLNLCKNCYFKNEYYSNIHIIDSRKYLKKKLLNEIENKGDLYKHKLFDFVNKTMKKYVDNSKNKYINKDKVNIQDWLDNIYAGNNFYYNLWDTIIENTLYKIEDVKKIIIKTRKENGNDSVNIHNIEDNDDFNMEVLDDLSLNINEITYV
jgi:hypothetical protein